MGKLAHGAVAKFPVPFDRIVETLAYIEEASNVYWEVFNTSPRTALFFGEKYYIRAGSSLAVAVFVLEASGYTVVKVLSTGGKSGLLDFMDWGASRAYVNKVIEELSKRLNMQPMDYREVKYLDASKAKELHGV